MTASIVSFDAARRGREPHSAGEAVCLDCKHRWAAVAPWQQGL